MPSSTSLSEGGGLRSLSPDELETALSSLAEHGFASLGRLADEALLHQLRARVDAIMLGEISYDGLFFQRDAETGNYSDLVYGKGWEGPSLLYRKVEKLELDELFRAVISAPPFRQITLALTGPEVSIYRACIFNKAAETGGSEIPWHQDGGKFWGIDREPVVQAWIALDDAPEDGGAIEVLPGTHRGGLATPLGGVVPADLVAKRSESDARTIPARAGEVILIHNHVWHRSGRGRVGTPRRAFTICYMDAATRCVRKKRAPRAFYRAF